LKNLTYAYMGVGESKIAKNHAYVINEYPPNIFYNQPQGTRVRGRPKSRWMDCVLSDIKKMKC